MYKASIVQNFPRLHAFRCIFYYKAGLLVSKVTDKPLIVVSIEPFVAVRRSAIAPKLNVPVISNCMNMIETEEPQVQLQDSPVAFSPLEANHNDQTIVDRQQPFFQSKDYFLMES